LHAYLQIGTLYAFHIDILRGFGTFDNFCVMYTIYWNTYMCHFTSDDGHDDDDDDDVYAVEALVLF